MSKLIKIIALACMLLLTASTAFAGEKFEIAEGADITEINSLALGMPLYYPRGEEGEPTMEELIKAMNKASDSTKLKILSYDEVTARLRQDKNYDFRRFNYRQAARVFRENVGQYADAYVILTVAKSKQSTFFFDVCKPGTTDILYTCQIQFAEKDSLEVYKEVVSKFYGIFEESKRDQLKANQKAMFDKMNPEKANKSKKDKKFKKFGRK